ncbi:MAG: hypothetical protein LBK42_00055 [Propionibacteriaceae bacterium]|jgi:hypothetical protein|nr:hypothetical protein [Propionibacteriaceae bacterium]
MTTSQELIRQIDLHQALLDEAGAVERRSRDKLQELDGYRAAHDWGTNRIEQDLSYERRRLASCPVDRSRVRTAGGYIQMMTDLLASGEVHVSRRYDQNQAIQRAVGGQDEALADSRREAVHQQQILEDLRSRLVWARRLEANSV